MSLCNVDYVNRLVITPQPTIKKTNYIWIIVASAIFVVSLGSGKLVINNLNNKSKFLPNTSESIAAVTQVEQNIAADSMLSTITRDNSPVLARVAGASSENNSIKDQSGFGLVDNKQCQSKLVFALGEVETTIGAHPGDEFNWVGALDVLPDYPDPFIIDTNSTDEFPWRSSLPMAKPINIVFDWAGADQQLELVIGWGLGNQGNKSIALKLDNQSLRSTPVYQPELSQGGFEQMKLVEDRLILPALSDGTHQLSLEPLIESGDPIVWDYIQLLSNNCLN